ncbi:MAG: hypothetical protein KKG47_09030 [Proteobacteria bacterium]|nr:hypothetical protein [Pseudomonadota bacterium]MBU1739017.1 hypothetical protein [Pseudomonadota bacterium]
MEIHDPTLHLKLIEMCDCYMETNFKEQLQHLATAPGGNIEEDSMKYLALAIMYAITEKARKLSFKRKKSDITVVLKSFGEKTSVKAPSEDIFNRMISIVRTILHLEEDKASMPLALGLRSGNLEVQVKVEREGDKESMKLTFPDLGD